jgi:hypothetical protein
VIPFFIEVFSYFLDSCDLLFDSRLFLFFDFYSVIALDSCILALFILFTLLFSTVLLPIFSCRSC